MLAPSRAGRRLHDSSHRWQPATILVHHNSGKTTKVYTGQGANGG